MNVRKFKIANLLIAIVSTSLCFTSCDNLALVDLPDELYRDTTYVVTDTTQLAPINPYQHTIYFDGNPQLFGFTSIDSLESMYYDYERISGDFTYLKTSRTTANLEIAFTQRDFNTYYTDVFDLSLSFLTPCGGILNGTKTRTIQRRNQLTSQFTTISTTITPINEADFSFTLWIKLVREGL